MKNIIVLDRLAFSILSRSCFAFIDNLIEVSMAEKVAVVSACFSVHQPRETSIFAEFFIGYRSEQRHRIRHCCQTQFSL